VIFRGISWIVSDFRTYLTDMQVKKSKLGALVRQAKLGVSDRVKVPVE
jgi:hypothetical protein